MVGARASATLRAPAQGTIAKLYVRDGDRVRKGQIVARIRSPEAEDQLRHARRASELAAPASFRAPAVRLPTLDTGAFDRKVARHFARAREEARKVEDKRARKRLLSAIDLAVTQYRARTKALASITAQLNRSIGGLMFGLTSGLSSSMASLQAASRTQAEAAVKAAERTVRSLTVKAPFAGVVTLGRVSGGGGLPGGVESLLSQLPGGSGGQQLPSAPSGGPAQGSTPVAAGVPVAAGDPLVTVTDVSVLTLAADVDETDVLLVREGVKAQVELDAVPGATYEAVVTGIGVTPWCRVDHADGQGCARNGGRPRAGSAGVFLEALSHVRRVAVTSALP
ncbi:HlyD family secretion protein [[Actinomadura] parvosata]|uniref:HlyD family secretion protein n=1 Tax=[Actinomadura] parvosata TaxID=1955412 RepID=UPI00406C483B